MKTKKIHPAVSEFYRKLGQKGGKKSAEKRLKEIIEKSQATTQRNKKGRRITID